MTYRIEITKSAMKEMDALSSDTHNRVAKAILGLKTEPRPRQQCKKLQKPHEGYRIRVGTFRFLDHGRRKHLVLFQLGGSLLHAHQQRCHDLWRRGTRRSCRVLGLPGNLGRSEGPIEQSVQQVQSIR